MAELAPYNASQAKNTVFQSSAGAITPKLLIIGTGDPTTEANITGGPWLALSAEQVGARTGFGFMLHRLALAAFTSGVETWVIQQAESGAVAKGSISFGASVALDAGTFKLKIANEEIQLSVSKGNTAQNLASALVAKISADETLPVVASIGTTGIVELESKSKGGHWGNSITLQETGAVEGITVTITPMNGGSGVPDIQEALGQLGTGDDANEKFFTRLIASGYGDDEATLDKISVYNGQGDKDEGCWAKLVYRPFIAKYGSVSTNLNSLIAAADARRELDRTNGVIAVPDSLSHPAEIAALHQGIMAKYDGEPHLSVANVDLPGIDTGNVRWTKNWNARNIAANAGISVTRVKNGIVRIQTDYTFYRPAAVPVVNNGYRACRTINIIRNILVNNAIAFGSEVWQNAFVVTDTLRVADAKARQKARDIGSVRDELVSLAKNYASLGWIYDDSFTLARLKEAGAIQTLDGGNGFTYTFPVVVSGQLDIIDGLTEFDISPVIILRS